MTVSSPLHDLPPPLLIRGVEVFFFSNCIKIQTKNLTLREQIKKYLEDEGYLDPYKKSGMLGLPFVS